MDEVDQHRSDDQRDAFDDAWIDAAEVQRRLGIKRQTLYAYASRGLVRTMPGEGRERRYRAEDVERLKARSAARAGHAAVASSALRWGEPVLDTAISGIDPIRGHHYRGRNALELAESARYEVVATFLWSGRWDESARFETESPGLSPHRLAALIGAGARPLERLLAAVPLLALSDPDRFARQPEVIAPVLVRRLAAALAIDKDHPERAREALSARSIAHAVVIALGARPSARHVAAMQRALILMADHELNASTFAARVAAGTGADPYACVLAALATLSGPIHGGICDRIEAMLAEPKAPEDATRILRARRRRGDAVPGFGHPLYPDGDPRTTPLLDLAFSIAPRSVAVRTVRAFIDAMALAGGERPSVDIALVALASALGAEPGAGAAIMAMGRVAGWIAHAIEQRAAGFALRPRARYIGDRHAAAELALDPARGPE